MTIKQYRKKPVIIEASEPITEENLPAIAAWCAGRAEWQPAPFIVVTTLEGELYALIGDRIIRGVKGEFYPIKPDIFDATYEAA